MKILVFGATGSVGRHVVEQALALGHDVTGFTRDPSRIDRPGLPVIRGDATDPAAVSHAVSGQDAVLVTLGDGLKGRVRAEATRVIVEAMQRVGVRRLICLTTIGVGNSRGNLNLKWKIIFRWLLPAVYADHVRQEEHVAASDLDWTIVRPASFTGGPQTGRYRHGFGPTEPGTLKIARADVADFMLRQLTTGTYLRDTPAVAY